MISLPCVASFEELRSNRDHAEGLGLPWLSVCPETVSPLAIVGGGRSALDFPLDWPGEVMAINGAHDWLTDRGRVPDFFMAEDPQDYIAGLLRRPHSGVKYLLATNCRPEAFKALHGFDVTLFDTRHGEDTRLPGKITGGGTAMTRAPMLGMELGYRDFTLFGADSCYLLDTTHVYADEPPPHLMKVESDGRVWTTTLGLLAQADYLAALSTLIPLRVAGDNLASAIIATKCWTVP